MMLEGFLVEATIARCVAVEEASALPTILASEMGRESGKTPWPQEPLLNANCAGITPSQCDVFAAESV